MICEKYNALSPNERILFVGSLVHSIMMDEKLFEQGEKIIQTAKRKGLFEGVTILPGQKQPKEFKDIDNLIN